ncbi:MAG: TonB-dependent receptor [Pseudomonadota bacterium]
MAAAVCALASPPLQAQAVLEEIVVTAQRRDENIQEVPISITNMTGDRLNARFAGGEDILALSGAAPGLYIETSNGRLAPRFYLRGLGNADFTAAASQPVSLVFDEVPMEKASLKAFPLFDMADIEVIRGPQGTLFGRNTTAGIVKVDTRRPTAETEGYLNASAGNFGTFNAEGAIGGTLVEDQLTGRVSFLSQNRSDWVDNGFTGENDALGGFNIAAVRLQLEWTPRDDVTVHFLHQRQDSESTTSLFRANVLSQGSNDLNDNFDRETVFFDGGDGNKGNIESHGTTLTVDWDIGDYTLTSITSYQDVTDRFGRGDIDGGFGCLFTCSGDAGPASTPFNPAASPFVVNVDTGGDQDLEQYTQEIRLASDLDGPFNYQVGFFYFKDDFFGTAANQSAGATEFQIGSTADIENVATAFFGQGSYDVNDKLTLTAGVRYTDDEKDAINIRFANGVASEVLPPINLQDDNVSWDLSFSYAATDEGQLYGRIASGFRAPTIQDRLEDDPEVTTADSETILSYEIGYKAQYDRLRYNAAAFYYVIDDIQLTAVGGASNSTTLLNADEGVGYGVEFEIEYLVTDNLMLSGGYGYNKTEINDSNLAVEPCGSGLCTVTDPLNADGLALIDGNPFQHAPEWTANFEIDYTYPLSSDAELYAFSDWKFRGETNDFLYESVEYTTDTQFEGGLKAGYRNLANNYQIGIFARNITDEENILGGIDFANLLAYTNEPRVWGIEGSWSF